jgi:hypothetical protein
LRDGLPAEVQPEIPPQPSPPACRGILGKTLAAHRDKLYFQTTNAPVRLSLTRIAADGDGRAQPFEVGLVHAQHLRQVVLGQLGDPAGVARAWDERTEAAVAPFYRNQITADRARLAEMTALHENRDYTSPESAMSSLARTAAYDALLFRAYLEPRLCLALPQQVFHGRASPRRSSG